MVDKVQIDGEDYLSYHVPPVTVAMIRGSTADETGNISFENEPLTLEGLSLSLIHILITAQGSVRFNTILEINR